jgi:putative aldouronate transport system permease protein
MLGIIVFTMFFNGGLIPNYLLMIKLKLINSLLIYIVKGAVGVYYLIIMKNYFNTLPESLEESAKIDGANDIYILWRIVLPISAPILATMTLFYCVDKWNDWYTPLIYISNSKLDNLQIVLRKIVINMSTLSEGMNEAIERNKLPVFSLGVRMAIIVVAALPILLVYPFLQKYFAKGIMIGSIKS